MMVQRMGAFRGDRLALARKKRGLSQDRLAEILNDTQQHISMWESGRNEPDSENIVRLATALGVSTDYLLGVVSDPDERLTDVVTQSELKNRLLWAIDKGLITETLETLTLLTKGSN